MSEGSLNDNTNEKINLFLLFYFVCDMIHRFQSEVPTLFLYWNGKYLLISALQFIRAERQFYRFRPMPFIGEKTRRPKNMSDHQLDSRTT